MNTLAPTSPTINSSVPSIRRSTFDPTSAYDSAAGYGEGTIWLNTSSRAVFILTNNAAGAPNWDEITETATAQLPLAGGTMTGALNFGSGSSLNTDGTLTLEDDTTSSANAGGSLRLSADDGSPMGDSHRLGVIEFTGAEDSSGTQVAGARIEALTDAAWTNVENGCALYFYTTDADASQSLVLKMDSNKRSSFSGTLGIGTTTAPGAQLDVHDTTTSSANTGGSLRLSANDGAAMGDSHRLGVIEFTGAEDSSNTQVIGARIEALTEAAWTNAENGTALYFYTTDGNASQTNVLKIDSNKKSTFNGVLDITDTTDSSDDSGDTGALRVEGGASIAKKLYVGTDLDVDGTANLDAVDIDGATDMDGNFSYGGGSFDVNSTGTLDLDSSNVSYGVTINTATSGSPVSIGHATSLTTINDDIKVVGAKFATAVRNVSDGGELTSADVWITVYASYGSVKIEIPTAQCVAGRYFYIKDIDGGSGSNAITLWTEGTQSIDGTNRTSGSPLTVINTAYGACMLVCADSSNWYRFGMNDVS